MQKLGTVLYQGKKPELWLNPKQWEAWVWKSGLGRFEVSTDATKTQESLNKAFDDYCTAELKKIIDVQIAQLRQKKVDVDIPHTDGKKTFDKTLNLSVDDYLTLYQFSKKLDYKIGAYEKEWGINEINPTKKIFTLHFNLNLIKYDSGEHIKYVVAHELTHVFHRDHGPKFQQTLERIYPRKNDSENFFNWRLASMFGKQDSSFQYIVLGLVAIGGLYWIGSSFWTWLQGIFRPASSGQYF